MGKDSFILYKSFFGPISKLSDRQLGRLFRAIYEYNISGVVSVEEDIEMAFQFFKNQFDIDEMKYQSKVERNRENGRRGGIQKAENDKVKADGSETKRMLANASECQRNLANLAYNDNENDNDKDIEKENNSSELLKKKPTPKQQASKFVKPQVADVDAYCKERNNGVDAEKFCSYYEANGWKVGRNPMKDWKAAVRTWERTQKTTSASGQSGVSKPRLGANEWITADGRRTYGTGQANIPMDAPPRPSMAHYWDADSRKWLIL